MRRANSVCDTPNSFIRSRMRRRNAEPILSIAVIVYPPRQIRRAHASLYRPTTQSPSFHQPRHTLQTHSSPPPEPTGNSFVPTALTPHPANTGVSEMLCWCESTYPLLHSSLHPHIQPVTPYKPKSVFPNATYTHRLIINPQTSAYRLRPYVAMIFRNIRRLGDIGITET